MQARTASHSMLTLVYASALLAALVLVIAGARDLVATGGTPGTPLVAGKPVAEPREDWSFVLASPFVNVLAHKPGLRPSDVVRSHAFGWKGPTIHEVRSQPRYLRILRKDPTLSPVDLVRESAGKA